MLTTQQRAKEIADAIRKIKLPLVPTKSSTLAHILAQVVSKEISPEQAQQEIEKNRDLLALVKSLEGEEFVTDRTQITFGAGNSLGDVSIRDIAGRDIINLTVHLLVASEAESLQTAHHTKPQSITHLWFREDELQQFDYQNFLRKWLKACVVGALFSILISSILFASTMSNYSSGYYDEQDRNPFNRYLLINSILIAPICGFLQHLILRKYSTKALYWIVVNALSLYMIKWFLTWPLPFNIVSLPIYLFIMLGYQVCLGYVIIQALNLWKDFSL